MLFLGSSTESKLRNGMFKDAFGDPLGPYNSELLELSILTFEPRKLATICSVLEKKLLKVLVPSQGQTKQLVALKCLTVLLYLCQWGSGSFMNWLRSRYTAIVVPLGAMGYSKTYASAVYAKVDAVVRFCEDDEALRVSRDSLDQLRLEMRGQAIPTLH
ncbi:hypothetical protein CA3LBN_004406 [Candidozyma haemuli]|uniref:ENTH domain-containing protein n=1 Tax=Candidozyma haemuli TaxID=45357 RepID=A0ABX8IDN9_9ASCO|nr:hypothetical protein CA3LBN_004406 [[Candida] haemuloni]